MYKEEVVWPKDFDSNCERLRTAEILGGQYLCRKCVMDTLKTAEFVLMEDQGRDFQAPSSVGRVLQENSRWNLL